MWPGPQQQQSPRGAANQQQAPYGAPKLMLQQQALLMAMAPYVVPGP
jgi:hypothetical protein